MDNNFSYQGVVTLVSRINNQTVSKKYYNNGTNNLFAAYARALAGQSIKSFIPTKLDIGVLNGDNFTSKLRGKLDVVTNYIDYNGVSNSYNDALYDAPYTRVSVVITKNAFEPITATDNLSLRLESSTGLPLAYVNMDNSFNTTVNTMSQGVQLILLWDLYVTNSADKEED